MQSRGDWRGIFSKLGYDVVRIERSWGQYCPRVLAYDIAGSTLRVAKRNGVSRICLSIVLGLREDSEDVAVAAAISWLFRISHSTSNDFDLKSSWGL